MKFFFTNEKVIWWLDIENVLWIILKALPQLPKLVQTQSHTQYQLPSSFLSVKCCYDYSVKEEDQDSW